MTDRPGFVLVVTLLLTAAFAVLGAGVMAVGAREAALGGAALRLVQVRAGAEGAAAAVFLDWSTGRYAGVEVGADTLVALDPLDDISRSARVRRLGRDLFLIEGAAALNGPAGDGPERTAGLLVRTLDHDLLAGAFPAPVSALDLVRVGSGAVSAHGPCPGPTPVGPAVVAPVIVIASGAAVSGAPPALVGDPTPVPAPDPFDPALAPSLATVVPGSTTVTPRPSADAAGCRPDPRNWGGTAPGGPCHGLVPFVYATGPLRVTGGEARGLLLVHGDAELEGIAFHGVIVASGRLTVGPGTSVRGAVRAREVEVRDASITWAPCEIRAALSAGGLDRAYRPGPRWWLPLF